jgi:integrase
MRQKTGSIQNRGSSFRISYYDINSIRQYESFATAEEAQRELAKRVAAVVAGVPVSSKPNMVKFWELADAVVTDYEVRKLATVEDIKARFRLHILPVFGERKAVAITSDELKHYILRRQAENAATGSICRELEAIKRAFRLAYQEGRLLNPGPYIPMPKEDNRRTGFFTRDEVDRVCWHLPPLLAKFCLFAFLTGWRLGEVRRLEWPEVDFAAREIRLNTSKNGEPRVFPMTDDLYELLKSVWAPFGTVFQIHGKPVGDFRKTWKTACYKAGIPCIVRPVKKGGQPGQVVVVKCLRIFHDFRRSGARQMSNDGVPQPVIMDLMGHKTDSMFRRYRIVSPEDKKRAVEIINGARNGAKRGVRQT